MKWSRLATSLVVATTIGGGTAAILVVHGVRVWLRLHRPQPAAAISSPVIPQQGTVPLKSAYSLGKAVAWWSGFQTIKGMPHDSPDAQAEVSQARKEFSTGLTDLGLRVDYTQLDFVPTVPNFYDSSIAAHFIRDRISERQGEKAVKAYELGMSLESSILRCDANLSHPALLGSGGFSGAGQLDDLNARAQYFGVAPEPADGLESGLGSPLSERDLEAYNRRIKEVLFDLDDKVRDKL